MSDKLYTLNYNIECINVKGPAGTCCVETLRQEGYDGRLLLITKENHLPYDRTKLSKVLNSDVNSILLRSQEFYKVR